MDRAWPMISLGMLPSSNMRDYTITLLVNKIFCRNYGFCITFCPAIHGGVFCTSFMINQITTCYAFP